jgi:photosystem II stability/assembly factor-like uncharacterized protein
VTNCRTDTRRWGLVLVAVTMVLLAACGITKKSPQSVPTSTPGHGPTTMVPATETTLPSIPATTTLIPPDASLQPEPLLQFASLSAGWMVDPTAPGRILATTDGGTSWWMSYQSAAAAQGIAGSVESIDFVNPSDGWALLYGEGFVATSNGGHTWSAPEEPTEGSVVTAAFTGPDDGWAITDQGIMLRSLDAGQIWAAVATPVAAMTMCPTSSGDLWLGGSSGSIYESHDGTSWKLSFAGSALRPPLPDMSNQPVPVPWLACDEDSVWALYQYGESVGSDPFVIERSLDGGAAWGELMVPRGTSLDPPDSQFVMATPDSLGVTGPTSAWVLGHCGPCGTGSASLATTSNGTDLSGAVLSTATDINASPVAVTFLDPQEGWAVLEEYPLSTAGVASSEKTVLLATHDGGITWSVVDSDVEG